MEEPTNFIPLNSDFGLQYTRIVVSINVPAVEGFPKDIRLSELLLDIGNSCLYIGRAKHPTGVSIYTLSEVSKLKENKDSINLSDLKDAIIVNDRCSSNLMFGTMPRIFGTTKPTIELNAERNNTDIGSLMLNCESSPYGYGILYVGTGKETLAIRVNLDQ